MSKSAAPLDSTPPDTPCCPECGSLLPPGIRDREGRAVYVCRQCNKTFVSGEQGLEAPLALASPAEDTTPPATPATGLPQARPRLWYVRDPRIVATALVAAIVVVLVAIACLLMRRPGGRERSEPPSKGAASSAVPGDRGASASGASRSQARPKPIQFTWEHREEQFSKHVEPYEKAYAPGKWLDRKGVDTLTDERWACQKQANDLVPVVTALKRELGDMKRQLRDQGLSQNAVQADARVRDLQVRWEAAVRDQESAKRRQAEKQQGILDLYAAARDRGIAHFAEEALKLKRQYGALGKAAQARLARAELDRDSLQGAFASFKEVCSLCIQAMLAQVEAGSAEGEGLNCAVNGIQEKWCALDDLDDLSYLVKMLSLDEKTASAQRGCYLTRQNLYLRARPKVPQLRAAAQECLDALKAARYPGPDKHVHPFARRAAQVDALLGRAVAAARDEKRSAEDAIAQALELKRRTERQVGKVIQCAFAPPDIDCLALAQRIAAAGKLDPDAKSFREARRLAEQAPRRFQELLDDRRSGPNCDPRTPQCVVVAKDCSYRVLGSLDRARGDSRDHWMFVLPQPDASCELQLVSGLGAVAYRAEAPLEVKGAKGDTPRAHLARLPRGPVKIVGQMLVCVALDKAASDSRYELRVSAAGKPEKIVEVREWHPGLARPIVDEKSERGFDVDLY